MRANRSNFTASLFAGVGELADRVLHEGEPLVTRDTLAELGPEQGKGLLGGNFIEGMACDGGCVQGAGIIVRSPKNQLSVYRSGGKINWRIKNGC